MSITDPAPRALFATSEKSGVVQFASGLAELGWSLFATTGTMELLQSAAVPVENISVVTDMPACLGHRLKTLHHKVFGGLLARGDRSADARDCREFGCLPFDMLICNFYAFVAAEPGAPARKLELIDIGGPAMLRAAAKNFEFVIPLSDEREYQSVLREVRLAGGSPAGVSWSHRRRLAARAFSIASAYDAAIGGWLSEEHAT